MESSCARMELSERNLPGSKQSKASAVRSRKMTKKICRLPLTSSALSDPVAGWEPISTNSHHHATLKEHKKQPRFCVVLTRAGAVPVLNLREKRASNRPAVLKPFFRRLFGAGQPSSPHRSRKSQAFVKSPPPFSPFSSIVTPYSLRAAFSRVQLSRIPPPNVLHPEGAYLLPPSPMTLYPFPCISSCSM